MKELFIRVLFTTAFLTLASNPSGILCSDLETNDEGSTNIQSSNHDVDDNVSKDLFRNRRVEEEEDEDEFSHRHGHNRGNDHHQEAHGRRNHETILRVEPPFHEHGVPPDPIIEVGEMVLDGESDDKEPSEKPGKKDSRPNIILIMTDDQDVELGSMEYMPETLKIFRENGIEFRHGYVATPMCCPSRSSILTGMYVHNHNVYTNNDNCSSVMWRQKYERGTFGAHLWSSGYYTSYIGKYLNKYDGSHIPYGWDEWNGLLMNSKFYNYTVNINGKKFRYGNDYETDYYPDVIASSALDFLGRVGSDKTKQPFLLVVSFPSPHGPEDSAPQYSNMFLNATPHHTPSYNEAPNLDKQWILRTTNKMTPILKDFTNLLMTKRLQTLQSVDVAVKSFMDSLIESGLDENTYTFYTSDHGYHVGQFGLAKGKSMPFEFDIRVPFYLRGPSREVARGIQILEPVLNIDLCPTFLELAGIPVPEEIDGRSVVPLLKHYGPKGREAATNMPLVWKSVFLIESSGRREGPSDPSGSLSGGKKSKRLREEKDPDGKSMLQQFCLLHPYPCLPGQKRYCRKSNRGKGKIQFRKCRALDYADDFYEMNDPIYQSTNNDSSTLNTPWHKLKHCPCRVKRSTLENIEDGEFDWDGERAKIDEEIEGLKKKIDDLRRKRRLLRRKWLHENNGNTTNFGFAGRRMGKMHEDDFTNRNPFVEEGREFSTQGFEKQEEFLEEHLQTTVSTTSAVPAITHQDKVEKDSNSYNGNDEEDEEDTEDDEDEGEEDGNEETDDTSEEEDSEEDDEESSTQAQETSTTSSTTTTTTSTTTTTPSTTKSFRRKFSHGKLGSDNFSKKRRPELGLEFEDFGVESFVRQKSKNRHRQRTRHRQYHHHSRDNGVDKNENTPHEAAPEETAGNEECDCSNDPRWLRQREKEERKRKKILSKIRKKQKYMKRIVDPDTRHLAESCGTEEKMNCFWHDKDHWKTAPFWTEGSFCFCMNSNNNTYSCLRSVNATHNYLYCQFVTGFKMYFDLWKDPYQLRNAIATLPAEEEDWMLIQLIRLKKCKGRGECWAETSEKEQAIQSTIWEQIFGRWPRKKKRGNRRRQMQM